MPYQDKQLKKEFITVDNRTIPFGYPQFWGGDDWEVSGRDNPLPVANYTRNEQGLWVPVSNENPVPTQLTGSSLEDKHAIPIRSRQSEIEVLPRMIRNSNETVNLTTPSWAKGIALYFLVYGVTGTFDQNEGIRASLAHRTSIHTTSISAVLRSEVVTTSSTYVEMIMYPNAVIGDAEEFLSDRPLYVSGLPITNNLNLIVDISGEFEEGEGFDCIALAQWLA